MRADKERGLYSKGNLLGLNISERNINHFPSLFDGQGEAAHPGNA